LMLSMNANALSLPSGFAVNCLAKQHTPQGMPFMQQTKTGSIVPGTISPPVLNAKERPVNMKSKDSKYKASSQQKGQPGWKEVSGQKNAITGSTGSRQE